MKDTPVQRANGSTSSLRPDQDAYGRALLDYHEGKRGWSVIIERDDGNIDVDLAIPEYFNAKWGAPDREALSLAKGRVLDVGAGAGRVALYLQEKGRDVVAIDNSPAMVKLLKARGVKSARLVPFKQIDRKLGPFDSIVMWGNNFGLFGTAKGARAMLRRLKKLTTPGARIIAQTVDIYDTKEAVHLAYHRFNRTRGRMPGELRIRVRYKTLCSPWFDYVMASPDEMSEIVDGTGWFLERVIHYPGKTPPVYFAILERED